MKKIFTFAIVFLMMAPALALAQTQETQQAAPTQEVTQTQETQQSQESQQVRVLQGVAAFSDMSQTHPDYVSVRFLSGRGILKGYSDGTYRPEQAVSRAEAVKIILEGSGIQSPAAVADAGFTDVKTDDWFAAYVSEAKALGIVNGNPDGTFAPGREVSEAEYVKMLLAVHGFKPGDWTGQQIFADVPTGAWFAPYVNYAGHIGLIRKDTLNKVYPSRAMTRGDVAQVLYLMIVSLNGSNTQFLLEQAQAQMTQIDVYVAAGLPVYGKAASQLCVDMTQQAYKNMPDNNVVLGAAKIARAYDYFVNAYVSSYAGKKDDARSWAGQAVTKATEAWEANNSLQSLAHHVKDLANGIIAQL